MAKLPESLNQRLKRLRNEWGYSQSEWAKAAKVATSQVGRWESTGKGEPTIEGLKGIAALKGLKVSALIGEEEPKFAAPRKPTPEEFATFFIESCDLDPKRKEICLLALTAETNDIEFIHDTALAPHLKARKSATPDHKKPLVR